MKENESKEILGRIAYQTGLSVEELMKNYDKLIVSKALNKDNEHIYILRKSLLEKKLVEGTYRNRARYNMFNEDGEWIGYVEANVINIPTTDEVEFIYESKRNQKRRGNMTIAVQEALEDIFVNGALDGKTVQDRYPKTNIQRVFLEISESNLASQGVARKSGFHQARNGAEWIITRDKFLSKNKTSNITVSQIRDSVANAKGKDISE